MRALELFAGNKSFGKVASEKGYSEIVSLDFLKKFNTTITIDILEWDYKKNKDVMYVSISSKDIDLPQAILLLENKGKQNESGELIGEEGKYKYVKSKAKFGEVIKRVSGNEVEYRNINKYKKEVDLKLNSKPTIFIKNTKTYIENLCSLTKYKKLVILSY
jgi:3-methyladenine DNA glycosylase AlkC